MVSTRNSLALILPAFNEEGTIQEVVIKCLNYGDVIVVDDGSLDCTNALAREAGAIVITHSLNRGYDSALDSGILYAAFQDYDYAITFDADGQHCFDSLKLILKNLKSGYDVVIGSRDYKPRFSELLFALISALFWKIQDPLSGLKGYNLSLVRKAGFFSSYKSIGAEFAVRAARTGLPFTHVPIKTNKRNGTSRFGLGLSANLRILKALLMTIYQATPFTKT